jgi:hypothetical protein
MSELEEAALNHNNEIIPFILRKMVPEFNSNSAFNSLEQTVVRSSELEG